ncbi:hypothetical protein RO21_05345 [[Actinobacillus] muris]|uniref:Uncharacterized protein n=1 Tax=Muribacter muris TaxID=67855 RepID=A0A0J5S493_9PAST|nr:hypothetical protein [Muribacter muris]KMK51607.1 hypothetical protein RO21_05345 [[Actinobacillus] muris] [Muribacter muris]
MQEIKNRIAVLKRKMLLKEIISLLGLDECRSNIKCVENDKVTLDNLKKIYTFSEKYRVCYFDREKISAGDVLNLAKSINWRIDEIILFVFFKERIQLNIPIDIFLRYKSNIIFSLFNTNDDIIIYSKDFKNGFCFIYDEYQVGFYKW